MRALVHTDDWWAVWIGILVFGLSLANLAGLDLLGWLAQTSVWLDIGKAVGPVSKSYASILPLPALVATYAFLLALTTTGAAAIGLRPTRFAIGFSIIFWLSYGSWLLGNYAYIAATPDKLQGFGIPWSLGLTGEAGFIIALLAGLLIGNCFPRIAALLHEATRPDWYIRTAIVILGAYLGIQAAGALNLAGTVLLRGLAAIVEAYLIYWALVYLIARRIFGFSREWAAPLASGISICGVSAAIATAGAIRARPIVPIMVSSLVVIFAVVELLVLPFVAQLTLYQEPLVAGAWMGLAVKTDGAAVASGAITDALIRARVFAVEGVNYKEGWILMVATVTKTFIDLFIGVWAFVLAIVWMKGIEPRDGDRVRLREIWDRFPKFVLGYFLTFLMLLAIVLVWPNLLGQARIATAESNVLRVLFFAMTFFCIGLTANIRVLRQEGLGRLAAVYAVSLFGFILWIGLAVSWVFFHGLKPPLG